MLILSPLTSHPSELERLHDPDDLTGTLQRLVAYLHEQPEVLDHPGRARVPGAGHTARLKDMVLVLLDELRHDGLLSVTHTLTTHAPRAPLTAQSLWLARTHAPLCSNPATWQELQRWVEQLEPTLMASSTPYLHITPEASARMIRKLEPTQGWQKACLRCLPPPHITRAIFSLTHLSHEHLLEAMYACRVEHDGTRSDGLEPDIFDFARSRVDTFQRAMLQAISMLSPAKLYPLEALTMLLLVAARHAMATHPTKLPYKSFESRSPNQKNSVQRGDLADLVRRSKPELARHWLMSWGRPLGVIEPYGFMTPREAFGPVIDFDYEALRCALAPSLARTSITSS